MFIFKDVKTKDTNMIGTKNVQKDKKRKANLENKHFNNNDTVKAFDMSILALSQTTHINQIITTVNTIT
jgi:hypothetical protein